MTNPRTLATYEAGFEQYLADLTPDPPLDLTRHREAFAAGVVPGGEILELGSGPGLDADWFEEHGLRVRRTDATVAFVRRLQALGHSASVLNVLTDDLGGPYDGIWASAVLLHLTRPELAGVLVRLRAAVRPDGIFAFSVKEGDGEAWVSAKLSEPRFFVYWRAEPLTALLEQAGWDVVEVSSYSGRRDDWLQFRCRP